MVGVDAAVPAATPRLRQAVAAAAQQGDYATLLPARWALFIGTLPHAWRDLLPDVNLALFILGLLAVRHGVLDEPRRHVRLIAGWMIFGALPGQSLAGASSPPDDAHPRRRRPLDYGLGLVQDQWLCLTYIGAVVLLLAYRPAWTTRLARVRPGRADGAHQLHGAGGRARRARLRLRLRAQAAAARLRARRPSCSSPPRPRSRAWLARYRFGPLEWLWRALTYARPQRLRRTTVQLGPVPS